MKCDKELKAQKQAEEKAKAEQVAAMVAARKAKEEAEKQFYLDQALAILKGIYDNYFIASDDSQAMISCGTVNYAKKKHVNVPIIYGDYFFTEALLKLKGLTSIF